MDSLQGQRHQEETLAGVAWNQPLQIGDRGDSVRDLQEKLKQLGYYQGKIDGIFGKLTERATRDFQQDYQLQVDGIIGPITTQQLAAALASGAILQYSSSVVEVKTLQRQLKTLQLYQGRIDGLFGPVTEAAVQNFQTGHALVADGKVGVKTKQALRDTLLGETGEIASAGAATEALTPARPAVISPPTRATGQTYVTAAQLQQLGWVNVDDAMINDLNRCLERYQINQPRRIQHFISQCSVESGYGQHRIERSWQAGQVAGAQYEGATRLGNTQPGDGVKYKGAGYIQLTGRKNYQSFADNLQDPRIMDGAEYVAQNYPWTSAGYYWDREQINALCDQGASVEVISKKVNCGSVSPKCHPHGLPQRVAAFKKCTAIFK